MTDVLIPGDVFTHGAPDDDHEIVALTRVQVRHDPRASPTATLAALKAQERRLQAQILRLAGMATRDRLVHVLLEFHDRLAVVGMVVSRGFRLPLTQHRLAEFLGVTVVHLNRTLQVLRRDGLIVLVAGRVTLADLERMRRAVP